MKIKNFISRGHFLVVALMAAMMLLSACGGEAATAVPPTNTVAAATNTTAPLPTNTTAPLPTNTTAPLPTNTTAPLPTNTTAPLPTNTVVVRPTNTTEVVLPVDDTPTAETGSTEPTATAEVGSGAGDLTAKLYDGTKYDFTITYPGDWEVEEQPDATNPDTDIQVNITKPGSNGNIGVVVISSKHGTAVTSKDALAAVVSGITSNSDYTNVKAEDTSIIVGNAVADASHITYDFGGVTLESDVTALVQGDRSYVVLDAAPADEYDANSASFQDAFASFDPLATATGFDTYTTKDKLMSISQPSGWVADDSDPTYTVFTAPAGDALVIFSASDQKTVFDDAAFDTYIQGFLKDNFESSNGYKFNGTEKQSDGSIRVSFDITGPNDNNWLSNGFFEQRGTIVVFSLFSADQDQWESYRDTFNTVANSIQIDQTAVNAGKSITTEDFASDKVGFTTLAPKGWDQHISDDTTIVTWSSPESDGTVLIQVDDSSGLAADYFNTEQNAIDYVKSVYGDETDFTIGATQAQPDGSMRVGWTMTGVNGNPWQGDAFLQISGDKIIAQFITADTNVWEQYLPGFTDILNSIKLK